MLTGAQMLTEKPSIAMCSTITFNSIFLDISYDDISTS